MPSFGKAKGGGHRAATRTAVPLPVLVRTIASCRPAALVDISEGGARLKGRDLPPVGEVLDLTVETLRVFGIVVWSSANECGIAFDAPISSFELSGLRRRAGLPCLSKLTVDERVGLDQWLHGVSR
jgi:hypothetical protein